MLLVPLRNCFRDHLHLLWLDAWKAKISLCGQVKLHDSVPHVTPSSDRCIDCIGEFSFETFSSSYLWRITYYCIHVFSGLCIQPPTNLAPPLYQISTIASIYKRMHLQRVRSYCNLPLNRQPSPKYLKSPGCKISKHGRGFPVRRVATPAHCPLGNDRFEQKISKSCSVSHLCSNVLLEKCN